MKDCIKLDLEELDIYDYKVLKIALGFFDDIDELYHLEIERTYYYDLMSKIERNYDKLLYNSSL